MSTQKEHKLCMIPGPIEFSPEVLQKMATPSTSHVDPWFIQVFGETIEMLRDVIIDKNCQPIVVSGSGTLGWDMTACNLVEPGEDVLVVNTGFFGDRFGECLETYGATVTHLKAETIGAAVSADALTNAIKTQNQTGKPFKMVTVTHVDTSTAVLMDVKMVAEVVKTLSPQTLVCVDGVCSIGAEELRMASWNIDIVITASQKALGCPPGLCVLFVSQNAIKVFENRKAPILNYFGNWKKWLPIMRNYEQRKPCYFATPAVQLIIALHTSLKQLLSDGMENRFTKHRAVSDKFKNTLESWGLSFVPTARTHAANTLTGIYYPSTINGPELLKKISASGVVLAGGLHPEIATKYFRVGHMHISSMNDELRHIDTTLDAIKNALSSLGYQLPH